MSEKKIFYRLKKDLIGCPKGRLFQKRYVNDEYFHHMTDDEVIAGELKSDYVFQREQVEDNPEWFEPFGLYPEHDKLYQFSQAQRQAVAELEEWMDGEGLMICEGDFTEYGKLSDVLHKLLGVNSVKLEEERIKMINKHVEMHKAEENE